MRGARQVRTLSYLLNRSNNISNKIIDVSLRFTWITQQTAHYHYDKNIYGFRTPRVFELPDCK